jgi:hypothetical protein
MGMMRSIVGRGLIPALLLTTTVSAAIAQDAGPVSFALSGSGGVEGFNLPTFSDGLGHTAGGTLFGGMFAGSARANLGQVDGWGLVLGLNAFGSFGYGQGDTWTDHLAGTGTVTGLDPLTGGIVLTTADPDGDANVTAPGGAHSHTGVVGGPNNDAGVVPGTNEFAFSAATSDNTTGNAYGGVGSALGGGFAYDGPVDEKSTISRSAFYGGADLTIGLNGNFDSATNVEVYLGPSLRLLKQGVVTAHTMDIPEVPGAGTPITIPTYTLAINDNLTSTYIGGVFGSSVSFEGSPGVIFTLGGQGGIYSVHSSWEAHDTYSTCCGVTGAPQNAPSPNLSVDGPSHTQDLGTTVAFEAKATGAATFAIDANKTITVGGNVGYLSNVPTVNRTGASPGVTVFGSSSMITYGASIGLTGHF